MLPGLLALAVMPLLLVAYAGVGVFKGGEWLMGLLRNWRIARLEAERQAVEAELDRKQDELRRTILGLAHALGVEAHEARKALIRESYLSSGKVPPHPSDT